MPAFRLFPRKTLRRKAPQNDITIHVSAESDHSHLAAIPPRRRRLTLRLPHWGSEKKQDKVSSSPSPEVDMGLCDPSPSKTLLSVLGADPECKVSYLHIRHPLPENTEFAYRNLRWTLQRLMKVPSCLPPPRHFNPPPPVRLTVSYNAPPLAA
ncbi:hypothetical protein PHLGIDRAFT_218239 [Phlebiopsis gigantea 11061_1 CR5-6]|uniref:Uncharacterized protein n=1 Tax=Phlebiopsis gigantea (strain 11061_1 CR5-6) TaxID=745531 RepID=A0A0C3S635_PHLG1|nr:hypothetical protein PHLGIDRAFT_218239 [Phlebiopsis gigantea 11061_1 CR5-6]